MRNKIQDLIEQIIPICTNWIKRGNDGLDRFVDPIEGEEISAHYGATHAASSFIIWGMETENMELYNKGVSLLKSILMRWNQSKKLPAFHFDFNNLALCLAEKYVDDETKAIIRNVVCDTSDSNHDTINWLPMRWAVNKKRIEWTNNKIYQSAIDRCKLIIAKATNADGGIEDRLPYGMSFNLQYDIATTAVLQYLNIHGEDLDLSKELGFLLNAVIPDGDINYQGRGTNQIFAWGLWVYLLATSKQSDALSLALDYLAPRLSPMLGRNNMMLNDWDGKEKYLWWDYHYASVYIAHCMLWLILAYRDFEGKSIKPVYSISTETGLHIYRSENFFVSWFEGRTEYLSEKGPTIAAIWSKKQGMIFKGSFGPWQGYFGNNYIVDHSVILNSWGLYIHKKEFDCTKIPFVHRVFEMVVANPFLGIRPSFVPFTIHEDGSLIISWNVPKTKKYTLCLACVLDAPLIDCVVDNKNVQLLLSSKIRNQYGWVNLIQSRCIQAEHISIIIR